MEAGRALSSSLFGTRKTSLPSIGNACTRPC